jgi:hypothetical protein
MSRIPRGLRAKDYAKLETCHYACDCREKVLQEYIRAKEAYEHEWARDTDDYMPLNLLAEELNKAWKALKKLKHD